jgi:putative transcriptional regulator
LTKTILSTAKDMYAGGVMNKRAYEKITLRHLGETAQVATKQLTGKQIRACATRQTSARPCSRTIST